MLWSGYYRGHGHKFQIIVTPDGMIVDVRGPYPGSFSDATLVTDSNLESDLRSFCKFREYQQRLLTAFYLYGDPAYAQDRYIQRPFQRANNTPEDEHYNALMSSVRVSVEHAIGHITNLFPALDFTREEKLGLTPIAAKFLVACIFRNMVTVVRGANQISHYFDCQPPTPAEFFNKR